ncbi:MAG: alpha/beta hydrolase [Cyanobacteria bacterium P01_F01_bin.33]
MQIREKYLHMPPEVLWLNVSPKYNALSLPYLKYLDRFLHAACWNYCQEDDEPNSLDIAVSTLREYLDTLPNPIHLIGHSTAGLVGLLYARRYPEKVKSLTLLSVGVDPAIDWQAHYFTRLNLLPCSRALVLSQMVRELFGYQSEASIPTLESILQLDLDCAPSPHTLWSRVSIERGGCDVPMFVSGSENDTVVTIDAIRQWQEWLKPGDRIWECPGGRYFFHCFFPELLQEELMQFWAEVDLGISAQAGKCSLVPAYQHVSS